LIFKKNSTNNKFLLFVEFFLKINLLNQLIFAIFLNVIFEIKSLKKKTKSATLNARGYSLIIKKYIRFTCHPILNLIKKQKRLLNFFSHQTYAPKKTRGLSLGFQF
jgi:hypothetical protein